MQRYALTSCLEGAADVARLVFRWGGIAFEDKQHAAPAPTRLEILLGADGVRVFEQSHAIARYVGRLCGLLPEDPQQCMQVDAVLESVKDVEGGGGPALQRALAAWNSVLERQPYLVLRVPTLADLSVYALLQRLSAGVEAFPHVQRWLDSLNLHMSVKRTAARVRVRELEAQAEAALARWERAMTDTAALELRVCQLQGEAEAAQADFVLLKRQIEETRALNKL